MAKAKAKAKAKVAPKRSASNLPAGYESISGFTDSWDTEKQPVLEGKITGYRDVEVKRGKKTETVKVCEITQKGGKAVSVWESAGLRPLFEKAEEGSQVYIRFEGMGKAKKGQNAPRLYSIGMK